MAVGDDRNALLSWGGGNLDCLFSWSYPDSLQAENMNEEPLATCLDHTALKPFRGQINASLGLLQSCIVSICWLLKNPIKIVKSRCGEIL